MRLDFDDKVQRKPVEGVDEELGGREEEVDGGKADHLGRDGFRSIGLGLEWQY